MELLRAMLKQLMHRSVRKVLGALCAIVVFRMIEH